MTQLKIPTLQSLASGFTDENQIPGFEGLPFYQTILPIRSLDDMPPVVNGGHQLQNGVSYFFDTFTPLVFFNPLYMPLRSDRQPGGLGFAGLTSNGVSAPVVYVGPGAFIQDSPDGEGDSLFITSLPFGSGTGVNSLFDIKNSVGRIIGMRFVGAGNFESIGTLRNFDLMTSQSVRFNNNGGALNIIDIRRVSIQTEFTESDILASDVYYKLTGNIELFTSSGASQFVMDLAAKSVFEISPCLQFDQIVVASNTLTKIDATNTLYLPSTITGGGTISDNGSGYVRVTEIGHGLPDGEEIYLEGPNPYRSRGAVARFVGVDDFDLLADVGSIVSAAAGAGTTIMTTDFKHKLSAGDTVIISNSTVPAYDGTWTVSSTPDDFEFEVPVAFSATATADYESPIIFVGAGEGLDWFNGSLNQTTPGIRSESNGDEFDSIIFAAMTGTGAGGTLLVDNDWTPIAATYVEQADCECQRTTVFQNGRLFLDARRKTEMSLTSTIFGKTGNASGRVILFTFRINGITALISQQLQETITNVDRNVTLPSINAVLEPGDYIELVAKTEAGSGNETYTLNTVNTTGTGR
jgi:hypothetical protein